MGFTPQLGEVMVFAGNFAPKGWAVCNGQLLSIQQNQALFSILGTTYGGDGVENFALPNLQGRFPVDFGAGQGLSNYDLGDEVGAEAVTITELTMAVHDHTVMALHGPGSSTSATPDGEQWAYSASPAYSPTADTSMAGDAIGLTGGGQPHENRPPYLVLTYCIALQGIYPTRI